MLLLCLVVAALRRLSRDESVFVFLGEGGDWIHVLVNGSFDWTAPLI